jgi:hypothetical protein
LVGYSTVLQSAWHTLQILRMSAKLTLSNVLFRSVMLFFLITGWQHTFVWGQAKNPDYGARLLAPTGLHLSQKGGEVHLSWKATKSTPEADYTVYASAHRRGPFTKLLTTQHTSADISLADKTSVMRYFCVTASLNQSAESVCSEKVSLDDSSLRR